MKLTAKTKPRRLTLCQMWELYRTDTGEETPERITGMLDEYYKGKKRVDVFISVQKYSESVVDYKTFAGVIEGMVDGKDN